MDKGDRFAAGVQGALGGKSGGGGWDMSAIVRPMVALGDQRSARMSRSAVGNQCSCINMA